MLNSVVCRHEHFVSDWYDQCCTALGLHDARPRDQRPVAGMQRKLWEWCAILQALRERDMVRPGRRGIGFACGRERLPAAFASLGAEVIATDQAAETATAVWTETGQHGTDREGLFYEGLSSREAFDRNVTFQPADMNRLEGLEPGSFDFTWSSCSFEHLGSLGAGLRFVERAMDLLRPGGFAVHTTEYNVSSDSETPMEGDDVIYRRRDLEWLERRMRAKGNAMAPLDLFAGDHPADLQWDYPPYFSHGRAHIKLLLHGHVTTSVLLIIQKGEDSGLEVCAESMPGSGSDSGAKAGAKEGSAAVPAVETAVPATVGDGPTLRQMLGHYRRRLGL